MLRKRLYFLSMRGALVVQRWGRCAGAARLSFPLSACSFTWDREPRLKASSRSAGW